MSELRKIALAEHKKHKGKLEVTSKVPLNSKRDLSIYYTPGVAEPCKEIAKNPEKAYDYTYRGTVVAVVTDGTAVLGLGNIGALAGLPVMEGKCALIRKFAGLSAVPICINSEDSEEIINIVKAIAPSFGGINLEDISAPRCFEIEERLSKELDIPVFHDDQHGTAIVTLAGLINALKVSGKKKEKVRVVISGAGAAGIAIAKLLLSYGFKNLILQDSKGVIYQGRADLNETKKEMAKITNKEKIKGDLAEAMKGADVFIGVSQPNTVSKAMVKSMNEDPIIFAMANPVQEISPEDARAAGARIIATGSSMYPNQVNNVLVFPGIFKGALEARAKDITEKMKLSAAEALANLVKNPTPKKFIPDAFDKGVAEAVAKAVKKHVKK